MGGWGRRFRVAITGQDARARAPLHLAHVPCAARRRRLLRRRWLAGGGEWHSAGGLKFGSVEMAEARFPLLFGRHEFRPGSAGDGQYRGGLGGELDLVIESAGPRRPIPPATACGTAPAGMLGGRTASRTITGSPRRQAERVLKTKEVGIPVQPGDMLLVEAGGGGGWGDPARRRDGRRAPRSRRGLHQRAARERALSHAIAIGIDVGGTFTDLVAVATTAARSPSPRRPPRRPTSRSGVMDWPRPCSPRRSASTAAALLARRPSASSTARPSRPTRCWSGRAPGSAC